MTPAAQTLLEYLCNSGCEALTARHVLERLNIGFNQTDDVLEEMAACGALYPPDGNRSLDRIYRVVPGAAAKLSANAAASVGPRSRLSGLAERLSRRTA